MQNQSPFTIYNASAGSGKTFTLVKDYLKILYSSKSNLAFRHILALTFTNKAVGEMKERVIDMLKAFSDEQILEAPNSMFSVLVDELNIAPYLLHQKSKALLERIVHNYAAFDISTIDKFNHKLIRTFAFDLKLPVNFEVELDTASLLGKAVDGLIDKAGSDPELTKVLVDFALEKTDDDKSWDISYDFNAIAQLLINENDIPYLNTIRDRELSDFKALRGNLNQQKNEVEQQIIQLAENTLELIASAGISFEDFTRQTLPNHFKKARDLHFDGLYNNKLQEHLEARTNIYKTGIDAANAVTIDNLLPEIETHYLTIKSLVYMSKFLSNALTNITPLSVLGAIGKSLQELKEADDLLLISEFNSIIHNEIQEQPAPFIYERIGEKFRHYFIDEFQDTSVLQWENLLPLISNAVLSEDLKGDRGTVMIVGDAKQAIYRWRGGHAQQFIDLYTKQKQPLLIEQAVKNLPMNFRSHRTVVEFNNAFFKHISKVAFSSEAHQLIYQNAHQEACIDKEGFVEISFLKTEDEDTDLLHCEAVVDTIRKVQAQGFDFKDIAIIVRRKKEGIAIAEFLSALNIPIISSETLMLKNAPEVQFINHLITLCLQPKNTEIKAHILSFIAEHKLELADKHQFLDSMVHQKTAVFFQKLNDYGFDFDYNEFSQLPIYEAVESIIRAFKLVETSNAYIQFYLDEVFDYSQRYNASFSGFLQYWESKKDQLSIASPSGKNALQIMTIHKSKGLEFPVVIFPYANQNIYFDKTPKTWFPVDPNQFAGFSHLYINVNKDLEALNPQGAALYHDYRSQLELDSMNLLYVVLTRPVQQLHIISEFDVDKNSLSEKLTHYSGLFINYLKAAGLWSDGQSIYRFGPPQSPSKTSGFEDHTLIQNHFISTRKEDHRLNIITSAGYLWDTAQEKAIERGNLVHQIMSHIETTEDIDFALDYFLDSGAINHKNYEGFQASINAIVNHEQLHRYFQPHLIIYNEKDIISENGTILRPDRVVINANGQAVIIDYKTGMQNSKHTEQLYDYQYVLEAMGFTVLKKILVYIDTTIVIKEF